MVRRAHVPGQSVKSRAASVSVCWFRVFEGQPAPAPSTADKVHRLVVRRDTMCLYMCVVGSASPRIAALHAICVLLVSLQKCRLFLACFILLCKKVERIQCGVFAPTLHGLRACWSRALRPMCSRSNSSSQAKTRVEGSCSTPCVCK